MPNNATIVSDIETRTLGDAKIPYEVLRAIPQESAEHYQIAPLSIVDDVLEVGMVDPDSMQAIDALNFISRTSGFPYKIYSLSKEDFDKVLTMYRGLRGEVEQAITDLATEGETPVESKSTQAVDDGTAPLDLEDPNLARSLSKEKNIQEDAPAIKIVSTVLRYAIDGKASDVHIEPMPSGVRVRYRVDGELHTSVVLPLATHRAIVARIKVLSSIRLDERRKPQDGRFSATIDGRQIDFRVSTFHRTTERKS